MNLRTRALVAIAVLSAVAGVGAERLIGGTTTVADRTTTSARHTTTMAEHRTTTRSGHTTTTTTVTEGTSTTTGRTTTTTGGKTTTTGHTTTTPHGKPPRGGGGGGSGGGTLTGTIDLTYSKGQCASGQSCFDCRQPVNLSLVRVRVDSSATQKDAIGFGAGCTGYIGRIDVDTMSTDGVKVGNAHNLTIGGGIVTSTGRNKSAHQDCMQALGGTHITFNGVIFGCETANNAQFYVSINKQASISTPGADIVCNGCEFHPGLGYHSVTIGPSLRSGVRNSLVCPGASRALQFAVLTGAVSPIDVNNTKPWPSDPRCW